MSDKLPRRDLWLLPLISALTVLAILTGAEAVTRVVWPEQVVNACRMLDPVIGFRYRPNCQAVTKTAEGPWVTNDYNACGYRSAAPCGTTPPDTRRVAIIGSSLSEGHMVNYADTMATRLGVELTDLCHANVEVQNLGAIGYSGAAELVPRMAEALTLKPSAVVLIMAPFDIQTDEAPPPVPDGSPPPGSGLQRVVFELLKSSRTVLMFQHFLFRNPSVYIPLYLRYGDRADFLRPPFTAVWQWRLHMMDDLISKLADQARKADATFVFTLIPQEAQVALMARGHAPSGVDPDALPAALRAIVERHGAIFVDTSIALRKHAAPEQLYYQVDGHLSGRGQPIAAAYMAERLTKATSGPFVGCGTSRSARLGAKP